MRLYEVRHSTRQVNPIIVREFAKVTKQFAVRINGQREALRGTHSSLYGTWAEAVQRLLYQFIRAEEEARKSVEVATKLRSAVERWVSENPEPVD